MPNIMIAGQQMPYDPQQLAMLLQNASEQDLNMAVQQIQGLPPQERNQAMQLMQQAMMMLGGPQAAQQGAGDLSQLQGPDVGAISQAMETGMQQGTIKPLGPSSSGAGPAQMGLGGSFVDDAGAMAPGYLPGIDGASPDLRQARMRDNGLT